MNETGSGQSARQAAKACLRIRVTPASSGNGLPGGIESFIVNGSLD
jgi:hypothetical protein